MASGYISKNDFIRAYQWTYGTPKQEAEYIWKISSYEYKALFMETYINLMAEKPFYNGCTTYPLAQPHNVDKLYFPKVPTYCII